ncbi:MAG: pyridoxal-phosphate dependent enzyme [Bacteroidetes bacterium]|nr:pyridoxal-phosphate dependent enzyme [Rhodothermia bacterium]MCS7156014.1 pyridoxal-phosphate dependent enzyme [Bacteroidota bacterium]MCX7907702.1 pyridoxal-phosphate dependent enzyme [Bacteroidota bacterium]MDW8137831.1 pyridoxal-phosphate dependent enzyme [Bacteroidota bacterium]MDW8286318.1 pyridoxal-phosphate dependent enzyme [Bacteroidota bacterium]
MRSVAHHSPGALPVTPDMVRWAAQAIGAHLVRTPLRRLPLEGRQVYAKLENRQQTGSFKVRGALAALVGYREQGLRGPWITASAGNHGIGLAYAAGLLKAGPVWVFVPENTPRAKLHKLRDLGAEVRLCGSGFSEAEQAARQAAAQLGGVYVSAYNDPFVVAGQGTIGLEILEEAPELGMLLAPVGGGGLLSGMALWIRAHRAETLIWGAQSVCTPGLYNALYGSHLPERPTLAEGLSGGVEAEAITVRLLHKLIEGIYLVSEPEIWDSMHWAYHQLGERLEGSAAVALAALRFRRLPDREPIVVVLTGSNTDRLAGL